MSRGPLLLFGYLLALLLQTSNVAACRAEVGVEGRLCAAASAKAAGGSDPVESGLYCETFCAICATAVALAPLAGDCADRFDTALRRSEPMSPATGRPPFFRDPNALARAGPFARPSPIG